MKNKKLKYKIANYLGFDLIKRKKSDHSLETHLKRLIDFYKPELFVDVGANQGQFGKTLRSLGFSNEIVSFEPVSKAFSLLKTASAADKLWQINNYAIGKTESEAIITVPNATEFSSMLTQNSFSKDFFGHKYKEVSEEKITIRVLDSVMNEKELLKKENIFLKTDTQGFDMQVLEGATEVLSKTKVVLVELSFSPIYEGMPTFEEVINFLKSKGFVPSAFFPVSRKEPGFALIEMDGVFVKE